MKEQVNDLISRLKDQKARLVAAAHAGLDEGSQWEVVRKLSTAGEQADIVLINAENFLEAVGQLPKGLLEELSGEVSSTAKRKSGPKRKTGRKPAKAKKAAPSSAGSPKLSSDSEKDQRRAKVLELADSGLKDTTEIAKRVTASGIETSARQAGQILGARNRKKPRRRKKTSAG